MAIYFFDNPKKTCNRKIGTFDKQYLVDMNVRYMLARTQQIFKYNGLPETVPQRMLENYLQTGAHCIWADVKNDLYVLQGGPGGIPDPYYRPTRYTVANPALNLTKEFIIDKDCVIMLNDSYYMGLMPMILEYATLMAENTASMNLACILGRMPAILTAGSDDAKKAADIYIEQILNGDLSIVAQKGFIENLGVSVQQYAGGAYSTMLKSLIEYHQFLKGGMWNELGLQSQFNMKREAINEAEAAMNDDILNPLIDDMLYQRQDALEKVNTMFGTNISVELTSSWKEETDDVQDNSRSNAELENGGNNADVDNPV